MTRVLLRDTTYKQADRTDERVSVLERFPPAAPDTANPIGPAGGDLAGEYPDPIIAANAVTTLKLADRAVTRIKIGLGEITDAEINALNKDGAAGVPSMRTLGSGALQAAAGNDARLSDARVPLAHIHPESDITGLTADLAGKVGTGDSRLTDARTPTGAAGGDLSGTFPNPQIANSAVTDTKVAAANKDGVAATPSMRTLGTGAQQAAAGNHKHGVVDLTATGTRDATTFLRGDNTWSAPAGGGGGLAKVTSFPASPADGDAVVRTDLNGSPIFTYSTENGWEQVPRMGAVTVPYARVARTADFVVPNNVDTPLVWQTEVEDTDSLIDLATNATRATIKTPGRYLLNADVEFNANATGLRYVMLRLNGTTLLAENRIDADAGDQNALRMNVSKVVRLVSGDYIEVIAFQNSGANLSVLNRRGGPEFTATWQGGAGQTVDERGVPAARVYASAAPTALPNNTYVVTAFDSEEFDTDGMHDTVTNNSRMTAKTPGIYLFRGFFGWLPGGGTGTRWLQFWKNGVLIPGARQVAKPDAAASARVTLSTIVQLAAGDYVELVSLQDSGAALNAVDPPYLEATLVASAKTVTPFARVGKSAAQTIASAAAETRATWDTESADNDGIHDTVTNNERLVCRTAGIYMAVLNPIWQTNATGARRVYLTKNNPAGAMVGANVIAQDTRPSGPYTQGTPCVALVELAVGDYVEAWFYHEAGVALGFDTPSIFSMVKVGAPNVGSAGVDPVAAAHIIGAAGEIGFQNGYTAAAAGYVSPRYYLDRGRVYLEGSLIVPASGTAQQAFTLPAGFRPAVRVRFTVSYENEATGVGQIGKLYVNADGTTQFVTANEGAPPNGNSVDMSGVSFRAYG